MDNDERTHESLTDLEPREEDAEGVTGGAYEAYTPMQGTKQSKFKGETPPTAKP